MYIYPHLIWKVIGYKLRIKNKYLYYYKKHGARGPRSRDCMVVGFTTTYAINAYHH